jgi:aquaporin Z
MRDQHDVRGSVLSPRSRDTELLPRSRPPIARPVGRRAAPSRAPTTGSAPQPAVGGFHPLEWGAELIGTLFQLSLGFMAVAVLSVRSSPVRIEPLTPRLLAIGAVFGLLAAAVATSPVGKRSGAHLNPAVTLGFFLRGHVHRHDVVGYMTAQVLGALGAAAIFSAVLGGWAAEVHYAVTQPGPQIGPAAAIGIEAGLTGCLLFVIFNLLSSARTARWTPAVVVGVLALLIVAGARYTGASMNPARTLGPATVADTWNLLWVYFIGPPLGAVAAAAAFRVLLPTRRTLTAKLFHDERYVSTLRTELPAQPAACASRSRHSGRADTTRDRTAEPT